MAMGSDGTLSIESEKLNQLAMNFDPKPFMDLLGSTSGMLPSTAAPTGGYANMVNPQQKAPALPPATMQSLQPPRPQVMSGAGIASPGQMPQMQQFAGALQPQPSMSQILYGR